MDVPVKAIEECNEFPVECIFKIAAAGVDFAGDGGGSHRGLEPEVRTPHVSFCMALLLTLWLPAFAL